jgi:NifU-like protein involved in Fe-S cluster formation
MDLLECVGENFDVNFTMKETIHNSMNKLRSAGLLIDKKQKHKCIVLTEEKLNDLGARLEHTLRKSLKRLAQETECQSVVQEG